MTHSHPRIAVVILNWNGREDTLECLASTTRIDYPSYEIVVVDNGSIDGSVAAIREAYPTVTIIETGRNLGYAGGNNVGIRWALGKHFDSILLLNNDTAVDPGLLRAFARAEAEFPNAGVFGGKIYYHTRPDILWFAGGQWVPDAFKFIHVGQDCPDGPEFMTPRAFDYMTGCVLHASSRVYRDIGLLDEDFFLTYEETDWCYRARKAGYDPTFIPDAKVWHKVSASFGGSTSPLMIYFLERNRLLWVRRYLPLRSFLRLFFSVLGALRVQLLPNPKFFLRKAVPGKPHWALKDYWTYIKLTARDPIFFARAMALRDFVLSRFGNCPDEVRNLRKTHPGTPQTP